MKKVLILGAGFLQDFVIRKAKAMGYETLAVDANPCAVGFQHADKYEVISIVDAEACLEFARKEKVDGVLTAATDYGVLTAAYIARELGLPGLRYEVAQIIKNKHKVRKCLFENAVDDTEQTYEVDADTDLEYLKRKLQYPVMVKPCDGSGSRGASRVDRPEDLQNAYRLAMEASITHKAEIESFIVGNEYGVESLVVDGQVHIMGVMQKWMTQPPYYAELGHALPSGLDPEVEDRVRSCVEKAIQALGVNFGSINMDLIITRSNKVYIVDIGARMGGNLIGSHIIPFGTGVDYMANMIRNAVGDPVDLTADDHPRAVATKLLALTPGIVRELPDFDAIERKFGVQIFHHLQPGQQINEYHTNLDGCGYVVAVANSTAEAEKKADEAKKWIDGNMIREV